MSERKPRPTINPASLVDPAVACCAGCSRLESPDESAVVLLSGVRVCTYCPAWLNETCMRQFEALNVLDMVDRETRQAYLAERERLYGAEYRARLSAVVLETWERRRATETPEA